MQFRTIQARYPGKCRRCGDAIEPGMSIRYGGRGLTYHLKAQCGDGDGQTARVATALVEREAMIRRQLADDALLTDGERTLSLALEIESQQERYN